MQRGRKETFQGHDPLSDGLLQPRPVPWWLHAALAIALVQHLGFSLLTMQRDAGDLLVTAQEILRGHLPYTTVYNVRTPGVSYLLAGFLWLFGESVLGIRALVLLANVCGAAAVGWLATLLGWPGRTAYAAGVLYLLAVPHYEGSQILTEPFVACLATLALCALLQGLRSRRLGWMAWAGVLCASAAWAKQVGIVVLPVAFLAISYEIRRHRRAMRWMSKASLTLLLGFFAGLGVLAAPAIRQENFFLFYRCAVESLLERPQQDLLPVLRGLNERLNEFVVLWWPAIALVFLEVVRLFRPGSRRSSSPSILLLGGLLLISLLPATHRQLPHYFLPAIPFAAILTAVIVDAAARRWVAIESRRLRLVILGLLVAVVLPAVLFSPLRRVVGSARSLWAGATVFEDMRVARRLREITEGQPALVFPDQAHYYFFLDTSPVTPHLYFYEDSIRTMILDERHRKPNFLRDHLVETLRDARLRYVIATGYRERWAELPATERARWSQVTRIDTWGYDTRRYHPLRVFVLRRNGS